MKKLIVITLALNLLIVVGIGHEITILGLFEIANLSSGAYPDAMTHDYQQLKLTAIFFLLGQILLTVAVLWSKIVKYIIPVALISLYSGLTLLSLEYNANARLSLYTGVPFLVMSFILIKNIYLRYGI